MPIAKSSSVAPRSTTSRTIDLRLPRDKLIVMTGLSGSGKSSLAFDTIYAEGQRRYVGVAQRLCAAVPRDDAEARRRADRRAVAGHLHRAEDDRRATRARPSAPSPRSTTICACCSPASASPIRRPPACRSRARPSARWSTRCMALPEGTRLYLLAPIARGRKGEYKRELDDLMRKGFQRVKIDGEFHDIEDAPCPRQEDQARHRSGGRPHRRRPGYRARRLAESFETALQAGRRHRLRRVRRRDRGRTARRERITFSEKFACPVSGFTIAEIEPRLFSFNNPVRRLPGLRRPGHRAEDRPRPDRART